MIGPSGCQTGLAQTLIAAYYQNETYVPAAKTDRSHHAPVCYCRPSRSLEFQCKQLLVRCRFVKLCRTYRKITDFHWQNYCYEWDSYLHVLLMGVGEPKPIGWRVGEPSLKPTFHSVQSYRTGTPAALKRTASSELLQLTQQPELGKSKNAASERNWDDVLYDWKC
jgi:hypothetical protein